MVAKIITGAITTILIALAVGFVVITGGRRDLLSLLAGDKVLELKSLSFVYDTLPSLTDAESLAVLSAVLRTAKQGEMMQGGGWIVAVKLSSGWQTRCTINVTNDLEYLTISFGDTLLPDSSDNYYLVTLPKEMPPKLRAMLNRVRPKPPAQ